MAIKDLRSKKHEAGRRRVPIELQAVFDELVEHYKFAGLKHYGTPFVSYEILADPCPDGLAPAARLPVPRLPSRSIHFRARSHWSASGACPGVARAVSRASGRPP